MGKKLLLIFLIVAGFVLGAALVRRQFRRDPRPENNAQLSSDLMEILQSYDANNDGILTKDELPERMQDLITRGDTNGDGVLSKDELNAMVNAQAALDTDRRKRRRDR